MRRNCVGSSVVSAMTQTPASLLCGLETTPPMSFSPILTAAASLCCCARAETDTPANNAAAAVSTDSLFTIFMSSSPAGPTLFQRTTSMLILPKPRAESTERAPSGPRAVKCKHELMWLTGPLMLTYQRLRRLLAHLGQLAAPILRQLSIR